MVGTSMLMINAQCSPVMFTCPDDQALHYASHNRVINSGRDTDTNRVTRICTVKSLLMYLRLGLWRVSTALWWISTARLSVYDV